MYQKSVKAGSQSGIGEWNEAGDEDIMKKVNEKQSTEEENTNNLTTGENGKDSLTTTLENNLCQHHANQVLETNGCLESFDLIFQLVAQRKSKLGDSCDKSLMAEVGRHD